MYRLSPILRSLNACSESLDWLAAKKRPTFVDAWDACPNHEWLLWVIGRTMPHREIVALACDIAEPALVHTTDPRPAACIAAVRRWLRGEAPIEEVYQARSDAWAVAWAADHAASVASVAAEAALAAGAAAAAAAAGAAIRPTIDAIDLAADAHKQARGQSRGRSLARARNLIRARFPASIVEARLLEIGRGHGCLEVA